MKRVAFLYLDHVHHVYHSASIALVLSRFKDIKVDVLTSTQTSLDIFLDLAKYYADHQVSAKKIPTTIADYIKGLYRPKRLFPQARHSFKKNKQWLNNYDALVVVDANLPQLARRENITTPFVVLSHGAGDRPREKFFAKHYQLATLNLLPGKCRQRFLANKGVVFTESNHQMIGYAKFDFWHHNTKQKLFDNDKPVVLYNPHFDEQQSSWYEWGTQVLDYFVNQQSFNLIFAPHIMLFSRRGGDIDSKYYQCSHIHIDLNSNRLIDMTYTKTADIYLGDVSSQVYEFIFQPRPCVFLNPYGINWRNNPYFSMWELGEVVDEWVVFPQALQQAVNEHRVDYNAIQTTKFKEVFFQGKKSPGEYGAKAISDFLKIV